MKSKKKIDVKGIALKLSMVAFAIIFNFCVLGMKANAEEDVNKPTEVKVNLLEDALGVPADNISLSWSMQAGTKQAAYRVVIGKTKQDMEKGNYIYDNGWVTSDKSAGVKLGKTLEYNRLYYCQIQVRDVSGQESSLSDAVPFSTEVGNQWKSTAGIWAGTDDFAFLRYRFHKSIGEIEKAVISVTASSPEPTRQYVYNLYLNETIIGVGPSRINSGELYYNSYDVTGVLKEGENVLGAVCYARTQRAFLCQMTIFYKDGSSEVVTNSGTDRNSWKALRANNIFGNSGASIGTGYYFASAENINSLSYPHGWLLPNYSTQSWSTATSVLNLGNTFRLEPYSSDNVTKYPVEPISVERRPDGSYVADMGREIAGGISLRIYSNAQTGILLRYGEQLDGNGNVKYQLNTGNVYEQNWKLRAGDQELPEMGMKTFRYVQIYYSPIPLGKVNITGQEIRKKFDTEESAFTSSNGILNDSYTLSKNTIQAGSQNLYVDTQSRERMPYEGDAYIQMMSSASYSDDYALARHSIEYLLKNPTWPAEYGYYAIMAAWQDYLYTGDTALIEKNYQLLKNQMDSAAVNGATGLVQAPAKSILVDWPTTERDSYEMDSAYYNTVFNSVCAGAYQDMASIASALGRSSDASYYQSRADGVKNNMMQKLYNPETGEFYDGLTSGGQVVKHSAQHATAFPLAFSIYSDSAMAQKMASAINEDGIVQMSVYGTYFLLQGLYNGNAGNLARQVMSNPSRYTGSHSWANMLYTIGCTTTAEAWDSSVKGNLSYLHPWGSAPGTWLVRGLFGIQPTSGGFQTFQMKLQPGGLSQASVKVPTIKGSIDASYTIAGDGTIAVNLKVPSNTTADVKLPSVNGGAQVQVNGSAMNAGYQEGYLQIQLGAGNYQINYNAGIYADNSELKENDNVIYSTYGKSWSALKTNGNTSGTTEQALGLQGIKMFFNSQSVTGGIRYSAHISSEGWLNWSENGAVSGKPNSGKIVQAYKMELTGNAAGRWDIYYRGYCQSYGWLDWAKNGQVSGTVGLGKRMEAIEVKIVDKGGEAPGSTARPAVQKDDLTYQTHVQTYGWQRPVYEGQTSGTEGKAKRLEGIKISIKNLPYAGGIQYKTHVQTYGWQDWVQNGAMSGTEGKAKRLEAIQIQLTEELGQKFDIYYRVHAQTYGWMGWAKNGEPAGSAGYAKRLEAIQIRLVAKGQAAPGSTDKAFVDKDEPGVKYSTHVQTYGWQKEVRNGAMSGTEGQAKRLEGIKISVIMPGVSGGVRYKTHVQTYGWQDWVADGVMSGTQGQAKRLEAIQIELSGDMAERYDIYYQVHAQTYGWLGWAKNGEPAGTAGYAKRLEGIRIRLVEKGTPFDTGGEAYHDKNAISAQGEDETKDTESMEDKEDPNNKNSGEDIDQTLPETGQIPQETEQIPNEGDGQTEGEDTSGVDPDKGGSQQVTDQIGGSGVNSGEE